MKRVPMETLQRFSLEALHTAGVHQDVAQAVAEGLVQTSLRGVDSHGLRLLAHYLRAVKGGRVNPDPTYRFRRTAPSTGLLDADHTFGHAAGMAAVRHAMALAREAGTGHVAIYNSSHFGAAAYFALEIANHDMIGMSFTSTESLIMSTGSVRPYLGNNPVCMAAPVEGEEPFCLDMATSILSFNKIRQLREEGVAAPPGVGADARGNDTTDPHRITMLQPTGGYKGYGLSMMVEILCSLLTGMPYGRHVTKMFEVPLSEKRFLGHFVSAFRIDCFQEPRLFKTRLAAMLQELRAEPRRNPKVPVMVPGDPEKREAQRRLRRGIPLSPVEYAMLRDIGREYHVRTSLTAGRTAALSARR